MSFLASFPGKTAIYVDIPAPSTKIILAGDQASRTSNPPSTCSSKTAYKSQSRTRHRALITDHGSAVTGSVQANLQLIHLINEIRGTKKDPEKAARRQRVEALLNRQEFSGKNRTFHLTSLANTLLLEPGLRIDLDLYALFCLTIPLNQLLLALTSLALDNNDWTNRAKIDCNAKRELDVRAHFSKTIVEADSEQLSKAPYLVTTIQVFVLHPSFQPNNMPLVILDPAVRDRPAPAAASHWKLYFSDIENTGGLVDSEGNALSLPWQISRTDDEQLSLFALIVNSYSKLRHSF
ncbi:hypothetical protein BT96DRAFT_526853 [Gymnopus androsaceus JB14]|uniref:Uncharacterized protein n=1 Tax=Gymnopus androsaceus JB14 TaxID=1447944 RepID=A0A6A4IG01_9AGAR|nr:hypothetical protein BT96DRAFT_526853 [Gymnopus androsaceus JB14]